MKKLILFMKRKDGLSFADFRDHYENVHVPLCAARVGHLIEDYTRYYPHELNNLYHRRTDAGAGREAGVRYDAVAVYSMKDEAALKEFARLGDDPEFQRRVQEDEERFLNRAATLQGVADEFFGPGMLG